MNKKVEIIIEDSHYHKSHKDGASFISVGFQASTYGSGSPCDNEDEMQSAISGCKEWIKREGDIPFVVDKRKNGGLNQWLKKT